MKRPLDIYDDMPEHMQKYISNYGWHFNQSAYEFATSQMKSDNPKAKPFNKDEVDELLRAYGIKLNRKVMYDYVYIATMAVYDFTMSIRDQESLAWFIKEYVDDVDGSDELPFRRWVASCVGLGCPIDWKTLC